MRAFRRANAVAAATIVALVAVACGLTPYLRPVGEGFPDTPYKTALCDRAPIDYLFWHILCQNVSFQLIMQTSVYVGSAARAHLPRKMPGARSTTAVAHFIGLRASARVAEVVGSFEGKRCVIAQICAATPKPMPLSRPRVKGRGAPCGGQGAKSAPCGARRSGVPARP